MKKPKSHPGLFGLMVTGLFVIMIFSTNLSALIYFNSSDIGFEESETGNTFLAKFPRAAILQGILSMNTVSLSLPNSYQSSTTKRLSDYIKDGAINFLDAYSNFLLFLKEIEASEANKSDHKKLQDTIDFMEQAKNNYTELSGKADKLSYKQSIRDKLINFDYDGFQEKNQLRKDVFDKVKVFLSNGNIRGAYKEALSQFNNILKVSKNIRGKLKSGKLSNLLSELLRLNQLYSESMFFGQYVAQVFGELETQGKSAKI